MAEYYAKPYDSSVEGFYFEDYDEYLKKAEASVAEEFEIDFIDGPQEWAELFRAFQVSQATLGTWFSVVDDPYLEGYDLVPMVYFADAGYDLKYAGEHVEDAIVFGDKKALEEYLWDLYEDLYGSDVIKALGSYLDWELIIRDMLLSSEIIEVKLGGDSFFMEIP